MATFPCSLAEQVGEHFVRPILAGVIARDQSKRPRKGSSEAAWVVRIPRQRAVALRRDFSLARQSCSYLRLSKVFPSANGLVLDVPINSPPIFVSESKFGLTSAPRLRRAGRCG
jgi:hypothetical protein